MILSESEAEAEYKATLEHIAKVALVQYGFLTTVIYVVLTAHHSYQFLSLEIPRTAWSVISSAALIALNMHLVRNVRYLTKLLKMHPMLHRKLRFLTYHHPWGLNPFGFWYIGATVLGLLAPVIMFDRDKNIQSLPSNMYWQIYIAAVVLGGVHVISMDILFSRLDSHTKALWPNRHKRAARKLRESDNNDLSIIARPKR